MARKVAADNTDHSSVFFCSLRGKAQVCDATADAMKYQSR
jgi:hypothetical protein